MESDSHKKYYENVCNEDCFSGGAGKICKFQKLFR